MPDLTTALLESVIHADLADEKIFTNTRLKKLFEVEDWYNLEPSDDLAENLEALYELEYKYQMIRTQEFTGHPRRKENILRRMSDLLLQVAAEIADQLTLVFAAWLDEHTIFDPKRWAEKRLENEEEGQEFESLQLEYHYLTGGRRTYKGKWVGGTSIDTFVEDNLDQFPMLKSMISDFLESDEAAGWDEEEGEYPYKGEDAEERFLQDQRFSDFYENFIKGSYYEPDILLELYEKALFPVWFEKWKAEGIEETRDRIEKAHQELEAITEQQYPPDQVGGKLSVIINIAHQTGSMIEYIEEQHPDVTADFLQKLSEKDASDWNEELTAMGVVLGSEKPEALESIGEERQKSLLPTPDLKTNLENFYELEYKISALRQRGFKGHPKRREVLSRRWEEKAIKLVNTIAKQLSPIFDWWIKRHDMNPQAWAEAETEGELRRGGASTNAKRMWKVGLKALSRRARISRDLTDIDWGSILPQTPALADVVVNDQESFELSPVEFLTTNVTNPDDVKSILVELNRELSYPAWAERVAGRQSIFDKSIRMVSSAKRKLDGLLSRPPRDIKDQLGEVNIIINTAHQAGGMIDFVQEYYPDVTADFLQQLSELDVTEWDAELAKLGVEAGRRAPRYEAEERRLPVSFISLPQGAEEDSRVEELVYKAGREIVAVTDNVYKLDDGTVFTVKNEVVLLGDDTYNLDQIDDQLDFVVALKGVEEDTYSSAIGGAMTVAATRPRRTVIPIGLKKVKKKKKRIRAKEARDSSSWQNELRARLKAFMAVRDREPPNTFLGKQAAEQIKVITDELEELRKKHGVISKPKRIMYSTESVHKTTKRIIEISDAKQDKEAEDMIQRYTAEPTNLWLYTDLPIEDRIAWAYLAADAMKEVPDKEDILQAFVQALKEVVADPDTFWKQIKQKNKIRHDYLKAAEWSIEKVPLKDIGVYPRFGGFSTEYSKGNVLDTAKAVHDDKEFPIKRKRILTTAERWATITKFLPPILVPGGTLRGRHEEYEQTKWDIDDGNHRLVAAAIDGAEEVVCFVGRSKKETTEESTQIIKREKKIIEQDEEEVIDVYQNPSPEELQSLMVNDQFHALVMSNGDVLVWSPYTLEPWDIAEQFDQRDALPVMVFTDPSTNFAYAEVSDDPQYTGWEDEAEVEQAIRASWLATQWSRLKIGQYEKKVQKDWQKELDFELESTQQVIKREKRRIIEKLGSFIYKLPEDKAQQLFDFYMLSALPKFTDDESIDAAIEHTQDKLLKPLKKELLDAVFYSVASELRHYLDKGSRSDGRDIIDYAKLGTEAKRMFNEYMAESPDSRQESFEVADRIAGDDRETFIKMADALYREGDWSHNYGGDAWANITDGWLKLHAAEHPRDLSIWIDHVYDLQHNTDVVFNKVKSYARSGGFDWIKRALDLKFKIKSPYELWPRVSTKMRRLAGFALKAGKGTTLQQWTEEGVDRVDIKLKVRELLKAEDVEALTKVIKDAAEKYKGNDEEGWATYKFPDPHKAKQFAEEVRNWVAEKTEEDVYVNIIPGAQFEIDTRSKPALKIKRKVVLRPERPEEPEKRREKPTPYDDPELAIALESSAMGWVEDDFDTELATRYRDLVRQLSQKFEMTRADETVFGDAFETLQEKDSTADQQLISDTMGDAGIGWDYEQDSEGDWSASPDSDVRAIARAVDPEKLWELGDARSYKEWVTKGGKKLAAEYKTSAEQVKLIPRRVPEGYKFAANEIVYVKPGGKFPDYIGKIKEGIGGKPAVEDIYDKPSLRKYHVYVPELDSVYYAYEYNIKSAQFKPGEEEPKYGEPPPERPEEEPKKREPKFKVGDKVKLTAEAAKSFKLPFTAGFITEVETYEGFDPDYKLVFPDGTSDLIDESHLTLEGEPEEEKLDEFTPKYKIGDRVKLKTESQNLYKLPPDAGIITQVESFQNFAPDYYVEFPDGTKSTGIDEADLLLVEESEEEKPKKELQFTVGDEVQIDVPGSDLHNAQGTVTHDYSHEEKGVSSGYAIDTPKGNMWFASNEVKPVEEKKPKEEPVKKTLRTEEGFSLGDTVNITGGGPTYLGGKITESPVTGVYVDKGIQDTVLYHVTHPNGARAWYSADRLSLATEQPEEETPKKEVTLTKGQDVWVMQYTLADGTKYQVQGIVRDVKDDKVTVYLPTDSPIPGKTIEVPIIDIRPMKKQEQTILTRPSKKILDEGAPTNARLLQ